MIGAFPLRFPTRVDEFTLAFAMLSVLRAV